MMWLCYIIMIVVPYLLGGVNTSIIVTKLKTGKDIRTMGSGNAGLTNTLRTQGKAVAGIVLLGDVAKAVLAIWAVRLASQFMSFSSTVVSTPPMNWNASLTAVFIIIVAVTRYVSLGSCIASSLYGFGTLGFVYFMDGDPAGIVCTFIAFFTAALVIYMHRGNIKRLAAHTEKKLGEKAK